MYEECFDLTGHFDLTGQCIQFEVDTIGAAFSSEQNRDLGPGANLVVIESFGTLKVVLRDAPPAVPFVFDQYKLAGVKLCVL